MPEAVICSGMVDRIGQQESSILYKTFTEKGNQDRKESLSIHDHATGLKEVSRLLTDPELGVIRNPDEIDVVGHRVVHGGESFSDTIIINQEVKEKIKKLFH
jgi:acetate kinase